VLSCLPLIALASAVEPPSVGFEEQAIVVEGLTPDAEVLLFGVGRGVEGFIPYQIRWAERLTGDAAGSVRLELAMALPTSSVWVAIELATGVATLAAPPGSEVLEIEFPGQGLPASLRRLEDARRGLEVLWVRPAGDGAEPVATAGAWSGRVRDGSGLDGDEREDRRISVRLDLLDPIGASPPAPEQLAPGDLLVGVDTETLEIYTFRLRS
jgi:hypothetical protein